VLGVSLESFLDRVRVAPGLEALVASAPVPLWEALEQATGTTLPPPFFAHAWPGSLALVEALRAAPALVSGQHVLDFACGGGLAGIVAAQLGARVTCTDIDPLALEATRLNARLNGVEVDLVRDDLVGARGDWQAVLVGDVFYEAPLAARVAGWLDELTTAGVVVLVGDPGRQFLPLERVALHSTHSLLPSAAWDSVVDRPARVWRWRPR
jgi:predicted nicotinamide N-methyase